MPMLDQSTQVAEQSAPPPSSGPQMAPTPSAAASPQGGAPGSEQPMQGGDVKQLSDKAIQLVYGDRFDELIKMFQTNGAEKFPRSMAVTINTALSDLEKAGPIPIEAVAQIGMDLMMKLLEDMIKGGVVPDVTADQMNQSLPATLQMYADSHPDVTQEDIQMVLQEAQKGVQGAAPETAEAVQDVKQQAPPPADTAVSDDKSANSGTTQPTNAYEAGY